MTTFIKVKLKKSDDQTKIVKYRVAANISEHHISKLISENHQSKIYDNEAII